MDKFITSTVKKKSADTGDTRAEKGNNDLFRARGFCWTINNHTRDDVFTLTQGIEHFVSEKKGFQYCYQSEFGKECGTPHIQGWCRWPNAHSIETVRNIMPRARLVPQGADHWIHAAAYCAEPHKRITGPFTNVDQILLKESFILPVLQPWQAHLVEFLKTKPDDRTITWICDSAGGFGKTKFCKHYMASYNDVAYVNGQEKYMKFAIMTYVKTRPLGPRVILVNYSRDQREIGVSYPALEMLKDGLFFNTHYEGQSVMAQNPHVVVFSNFYPQRVSALTNDKWNILDLRKLRIGEKPERKVTEKLSFKHLYKPKPTDVFCILDDVSE